MATVIAIFCNTVLGYACICKDNRTFEQKIEDNKFIAHIKITNKVIKQDTTQEGGKQIIHFSHQGQLKFEILELFKGPRLTTITQYDINTSCDIGIYPGEEWILYASYDSTANEYTVGACSPSTMYKNKEGETERLWGGSGGLLNALRTFFNHPQPVYTSGKYSGYYSNGNKEWEEVYENGKLHGYRSVYYSSGGLMKNENYLNGQHDGVWREYTRQGQLFNELEYSNGHIIHSTYWYDTTFGERRNATLFYNMLNKKDSIAPPIIQKSSEGWYDTTTGNRHSIVYSRTGFVEREYFSNNNGDTSLSCEYEENGRLKFEVYYLKEGDITTEKKWNERGWLISEKRWEKGKFIKTVK
jgi:antitoxin component YwqK of YwqJK toxin-antitoxin module